MEGQFCLNWPAIVEEARQRRKKLKCTQKRLALLAKVSTPTVSRFEQESKDIQLSSILNILGVLGMLDKRYLIFPESRIDKAYYIPNRMAVMFLAQNENNKEIRCEISKEALEDHYMQSAEDLNRKNMSDYFLKIFLKNQLTIEHEARRKYLQNQIEEDNSILIKSSDL